MIPKTRRHAILDVLEFEHRVKQLALAAYRAWLPAARRHVLPSLTAAAEQLPPDPEAIAMSQAEWETVLDDQFIPGLGELLFAQMAGDMAAAGMTAAEAAALAGTEPPRPDAPLTAQRVAAIPSVQDWANTYLAEVRNRMVRTPDTAFDMIRTEVQQGAEAGESIPQQRDRIAQILSTQNLETFGGQRATTVARTESAGALNGARLQSARVMGIVEDVELQKVWVSTIDSRTRRTHKAVDGQRVGMDEPFQLPGGVKLQMPGDPRGPAAEVINCRCTTMIVEPDEPLPDESDRHTERGPGDATVRNRDGRTQAEEIRRWEEEEGVIRARDDPDGVGRIVAAAPPAATIPRMPTFTAVLANLGVRTDDGRILDTTMDLRFRDTPLPLRWQRQDVPEHMEAFTVGVIDSIELDGATIRATGHMLDTAEAAEAETQIREGVTAPSVDLADVAWELRTEDGKPITDGDDISEDEQVVFVVTSAIVTAATLVSIPAFGDTSITLDDTETGDDQAPVVAAALTAATEARFRPDPTMFANPNLDGPTPLHMTDDGRIIGHLAVFNTCHVGISDHCVTAPRSATGYAHFHTSAVETLAGERIPVGRLTVGGGHAEHGLGFRAAVAHYDDTGTCWAYVRAGEDDHGIWVAGVLHPDATDAQVREGLSAPLSGDWRTIGGNLELVAALSVNTPGFPVVSGRRDESGRDLVLVAALAPRPTRDVDTTILQSVAAMAVREFRAGEARRSQARRLVHDVRAARRAEVRALAASIAGGR